VGVAKGCRRARRKLSGHAKKETSLWKLSWGVQGLGERSEWSPRFAPDAAAKEVRKWESLGSVSGNRGNWTLNPWLNGSGEVGGVGRWPGGGGRILRRASKNWGSYRLSSSGLYQRNLNPARRPPLDAEIAFQKKCAIGGGGRRRRGKAAIHLQSGIGEGSKKGSFRHKIIGGRAQKGRKDRIRYGPSRMRTNVVEGEG